MNQYVYTYKQGGNSNLDCVPRTAVVAMSDGGGGNNISIKTLQKCPEIVDLFKKTAERVLRDICRNILINVSVLQKCMF